MPFANLRTLELTASHPLEHLISTLSTFASSSLPSSSHSHSSTSQPHNSSSSLEEIILECHEDDIEEYFDVLAEWVDELLEESSFDPQVEFDGDYPMSVEDADYDHPPHAAATNLDELEDLELEMVRVEDISIIVVIVSSILTRQVTAPFSSP
ncbi:hypothetical protein BDY19DRAFT_997488 [Irpex rosettiformis]|uniref:Uncharacterized protein n=1 Tax=Irpex rosettiformis TaxID=378272 RepID=A0ACB8TRZ0_9APHY|nr:hypothetical protein BDY19DRAFT_997488 [Irpex rosettiformis]